MSAPPKCSMATANIRSSCAQSVTSVCWNTAFAPLEVRGYFDTTASASGRRARSAKTTLQPLSRSLMAKQRLMPEPAPVTMAVLPVTFIAIVRAENTVRMWKCKQNEVVTCLSYLSRGLELFTLFAAMACPSAAFLMMCSHGQYPSPRTCIVIVARL